MRRSKNSYVDLCRKEGLDLRINNSVKINLVEKRNLLSRRKLNDLDKQFNSSP
jgi:hypothetical protein